MADKKALKDFPDVNDKLNAPKKISVFERQRQDAEAKRLREEAETRKALREFEDSFADEDEDDDPISRIASSRTYGDAPSAPRGAGLGSGGYAGPGPRHFPTQAGPRSAGPGTLGPPPMLKRKRDLDDRREDSRWSSGRDRKDSPDFGRADSGPRDVRRVLGQFDEDDNEEERRQRRTPEPAVRKPTMLLTCLPPGTKAGAVKAWIPSSLKVEEVTFLQPTGPDARTQRTLSAIVAMTADTPVSEVDIAVGGLQNKYLGFGFYLNISRHVSSSGGLGVNLQQTTTTSETQPFGARPIATQHAAASLRNAPPPSSFGNYPPPNSYSAPGPAQSQRASGPVQVPVALPSDIKQLKIINRTVEQLSSYGPQFEALLMSRPEVQHDEKWAWLFDSASQGGIYYRWLVWNTHSEDVEQWDDEAWAAAESRGAPSGSDRLFDNAPPWLQPIDKPKFEHVNNFEEFVEDDEYVSSDDDSGDEGVQRQFHTGHGPAPAEASAAENISARYLNPYRRAKFTFLLARLPESIALLRTGDVARVTSFVVNNAGHGAEEIVDMLIANVEYPYRLSVLYGEGESVFVDGLADSREHAENGKKDNSNSRLIALYLISDALQASSTSGIRDAWKYRALFETALRARKTFELLGKLEKEMQWGRMKSEQWKRKVGVVLGLWEQMSVFPAESHEEFKKSFDEPPLTAEEQRIKEEDEQREREETEKRRWRDAGARREEEEKRAEDEKRVEEGRRVREEQQKRDAEAALTDEQNKQADRISDRIVEKQSQAAAALEERLERPTRKARPTAAELISASDSRSETSSLDPTTRAEETRESAALPPTVAKASVPTAAPPMKLGSGFGFSMSLGSGGTTASAPNVTEEQPEVRGAEDMFADSDRE